MSHTSMSNAIYDFPNGRLRNRMAHRRLDEAVAEAYGWGDDWRAGRLIDDEILARLFALNQARAEGKR